MNNEKINEYIEDLLEVACCPDHDYSCRQVYEYVKQLQKQKDDVVEIIKRQLLSNTNITKYTDEMCLRDILRMLGEIE